MDKFLTFTIAGLSTAAIYAIAASGLVVTYTTSGIFNFAHGAFGMMAAFTYWQVNQGWGVPTIPSVIIVVFVIAPLFGALIERVNAVLRLASRGQHEDGSLEVGPPQARADVEAVPVRQHPVDDGKVELGPADGLRAGRVARERDRIAARLEDAHEQRAELGVILDEEQAHGGHSRLSSPDVPYGAVSERPAPPG